METGGASLCACYRLSLTVPLEIRKYTAPLKGEATHCLLLLLRQMLQNMFQSVCVTIHSKGATLRVSQPFPICGKNGKILSHFVLIHARFFSEMGGTIASYILIQITAN